MRPEKRSFSIEGHRTSISLEKDFWLALKQSAAEDGVTLASLISSIDKGRGEANLSSAVRVWILHRLQERAAGKFMNGEKP